MVARLEDTCKCGFKWNTFHICIDFSGPEPELPPEKPKRKSKPSTSRYTSGVVRGTDEWRKAISEGMQTSNTERQETARKRNDKIVEGYRAGKTVNELAATWGLSKQSIKVVLWKARDEGRIEMRRQPKRPEVLDRDKKIIESYLQEKPVRQVALEVGVAYMTAQKVLHEARDRGELTMRTRTTR